MVTAFYALNAYIYREKQGTPPVDTSVIVTDYKNGSYTIDGHTVTLTDGLSEVEAAPGSASKIITRYFGNEVRKDLDGDGREDVVFLITQEGGGSGTFFYVVAALKRDAGYQGSEGLFLGDRIAPQTTESGPGASIIINYADRASNESFAVRPSIGKSIRLLLDSHTLQWGEVADQFEGEADPSRMTLGMKSWVWIKTLYNNDTVITPTKEGVFTLTLQDDGTFSATTDCNSMSGKYTADDHAISFGPIASTKKYCAGSQEGDFASFLEHAAGYLFTSRGELVIELTFDSGSVIFR